MKNLANKHKKIHWVYTNLYWFTLVELIVVITIIAILGTIGFVSYSSYLVTTRDSNRISQLVRISDALQIYSTRDVLPTPENSVAIEYDGTVIGYQWELWDWILQAIDYSRTARDPRDNSPYTYYVTVNRENFQLLALMEEADSLQSSRIWNTLSETYANLSNRFPKTYGQRLWVFTDMENNPLQRISTISGSIEITNPGLTLKSFLSDNEFIVSTWDNFSQLPQLLAQGWSQWIIIDNEFRTLCSNADNILVWEYTISPCNIWAQYVSNTGKVFQWWQDKAWDFSAWVWSQDNCTWDRDIQECTSPSLNSWPSSPSELDSGFGSGTWWPAWWDPRWPCQEWYRVPSRTDWENIVTAGGWQSWDEMRDALAMPYGFKRWDNWSLNNVFSIGRYWASTPSSSNAHYVWLNWHWGFTGVSTDGYMQRHNWLQVRCIR